MVVYAKSALAHLNINTKLDIGCDGIEIQLLDELVNGKVGQYFMAEDIFDLDSSRGIR